MLKHWRAVLGALLFVKPIWEGTKWLLDWLGRADLAASILPALGVQAVIDFVLNPPGWTVWPTVIFGGLLIWWDLKRKEIEAHSFDANQKLLAAFYAGCAAIAIAVWVIAWPLYFPAKAAPAPVPPIATPAPPKPAPPPPAP